MRLVSSAAVTAGARRLRSLATVSLAVCAIALIAAQHARAASWPWTESAATLGLPANVDTTGDGNADGTSCSPTDSCVTVGTYTVSSGAELPYVEPITDGVPGTAVAVTLPAGAYAGADQEAYLINVSCQSGNVCEAFGTYDDASENPVAMVVQITDGVPAQAVEIAGPSDSASPEDVSLNAISCPLTGACEAVGYYQSTTTGEDEPLAVQISGGMPGAETGVTLPSNHGSGGDEHAQFKDVACQATGVCAAVGAYEDSDGDTLPLEDAISGGTPAAATEPSVPSGATQVPSYLTSVACPRSGACEALGYEDSGSGDGPMFAVPITGGAPASAVAVSALPSSAEASSSLVVGGFACSSASLCLAAGYYRSASGDLPETITITASGAAALTTALPSNAFAGAQDAGLYSEYANSVGCVPGGFCLAGGYYETESGDSAYSALMALLTPDGTVTSEAATAPAEQSSTGYYGTGPYTYLYSGTSCDDAGSCISTGVTYIAARVALPYEVVEQAPLAVSTTTLPGASQNVAYPSTTLAASGAWGVYTWAVSSGSLPAGLSLNAQTGVISGTPTGSGTASFTVQVTGTGSPVPTATEQLSIAVAAAPKAALRLLGASGKVSAGKLGVKLACTGAACAGTVKLELTKTVTVKKGKKRVRKHETVVIGSAGYSLAVGATKTVEVKLNGAGKRALAAAKKHRLKVTELASLTGGKSVSRSATIYTATKKKTKKKKG